MHCLKFAIKSILVLYPPLWPKLRAWFCKVSRYDEGELALPRYFVDPRRGAVDVGANDGVYTYALFGITDTVVAVAAIAGRQVGLGYRALFLDNGVLRLIAHFDPKAHQSERAVAELRTGDNTSMPFCNNFFFIPESDAWLAATESSAPPCSSTQ